MTPNLYLHLRTTIALGKDLRWLVRLHPEISHSTAIHKLAQLRSLIAFGHISSEPKVLPALQVFSLEMLRAMLQSHGLQ